MISIEYPWGQVGFGNHLFIYTYARLLSENLNIQLTTNPFMLSERNGKHNNSVFQFENIVGEIFESQTPIHITDSFAVGHKTVDSAIDYLSGKKNKIILNGYFPNYRYWKGYKNEVRFFFKNLISNEDRKEDELAIHLRNSMEDTSFKLSINYYLESIEKMKPKKIFLYADNFMRHQELISKLKNFDVETRELNVLDSFNEITSFKNLICSQGTFSFWVGFLGKSKKVIWPITKEGPNRIENNWATSYIVDDEDKYEFVEL